MSAKATLVLVLSLLTWNLFIFGSSVASATECEGRLNSHPFVRLTDEVLRQKLITTAELISLTQSPEPYNPLRGKTLTAADSTYAFAFDRLLKAATMRAGWLQLQQALASLYRQQNESQTSLRQHRQKARVFFAPKIIAHYPALGSSNRLAVLQTRGGEIYYAYPNADRILELRQLGRDDWVERLPALSLKPFSQGFAHVSLSEDAAGEIWVHLHALTPGGHQLTRVDYSLTAARPLSYYLGAEGATGISSAAVLPDGRHALQFTKSNWNFFRAFCQGRECVSFPEESTNTEVLLSADQLWSLEETKKVSRLRRLSQDRWVAVGNAMPLSDDLHTSSSLFATRDQRIFVGVPRKDGVHILEPLAEEPLPPIVIKPEPRASLFATRFFETVDSRILFATISSHYNNVSYLKVFAPLESDQPIFKFRLSFSNPDAVIRFFEGGDLGQTFLNVQLASKAQLFEPLANTPMAGKASLPAQSNGQAWISRAGQTYVISLEENQVVVRQLFQGLNSPLEADPKTR